MDIAQHLIVKCPTCGAKPGETCTYLNPYPDRQGQSPQPWMSQSMKHHLSLAGTPMRRAHLPRSQRAYRVVQHQRQLRERIERDTIAQQNVPDDTKELFSIGRALRAFDVMEFYNMRNWLQAYGSIFQVKEE